MKQLELKTSTEVKKHKLIVNTSAFIQGLSNSKTKLKSLDGSVNTGGNDNDSLESFPPLLFLIGNVKDYVASPSSKKC